MPAHRPSTSDSQRLRLPPLKTPNLAKQTTNESLDGSSTINAAADRVENRYDQKRPPAAPQAQNSHQRFVLTDPLAFRYLLEDSATEALDRERELRGYECYVVEQWATSRSHPTFVITTYTGDRNHKVIVSVLNVPTDERTWSQRLRVYFRALNHYHATRRETELGILMVSNLAIFPSSLTVILIPDGHVRNHRVNFTVNKDLKRLGCAGRVALTLSTPAAATTAKFHQIYRTSDKNEISSAVLELVKLCQTALMLFGKLNVNYADGLLCDVTERAVKDWWLEIGHENYDMEPHDGILGPTTVAGLLGLLMGARNRLHAANAPVGKDAFDVEAMKKGISHYQKQHKLPRTRRLDSTTLRQLLKSTDKAAHHDGWVVPKAVKSTVAELSGKGGEMVMDVVGRRDRAGIAEIETCDIDRFSQLVYGEEPKWLWQGKQIKNNRGFTANKLMGAEGLKLYVGLTFEPDAQGGFTWTARRSTIDALSPDKRHHAHHSNLSVADTLDDETDEDEPRHISMFKRTSTLRHEAKTGIGKLKGAVRRRGHHPIPSVEDSQSSTAEDTSTSRSRRPIFRRTHSSPLSSPTNSPKSSPTNYRIDNERRLRQHRGSTGSERSRFGLFRSPDPYGPSLNPKNQHSDKDEIQNSNASEDGRPVLPLKGTSSSNPKIITNQDVATDQSARNSVDGKAQDHKPDDNIVVEQNADRLLKRANSLNLLAVPHARSRSENMLPRQLSFSLAEEGVLSWPDLGDESFRGRFHDAKAELAEEELIASRSKDIATDIDILAATAVTWTQEQLQAVQDLVDRYEAEQQRLDEMFDSRLEASNNLHTTTEIILKDQKDQLEEGSKEIETLISKLDYEISGLRSRVEEVEAGVNDYERGVRRVEERVAELEREGHGSSRCVLQ